MLNKEVMKLCRAMKELDQRDATDEALRERHDVLAHFKIHRSMPKEKRKGDDKVNLEVGKAPAAKKAK